jgi:Na+-translocating ferredoxin:NAD+ oxidoreductase subunit B
MPSSQIPSTQPLPRRTLLCSLGLTLAGLVTFGLWSRFSRRTQAQVVQEQLPDMRWQLDPNKCIACGRCQVNCVLTVSAVKCVHAYDICGYCRRCSGYFEPKAAELNTAAENQQCPMGAIKRTFIEDPYYEYHIDEALCTACGKCVRGCREFGNGSLFLQVRHDRCLNCNQCSIASACPAQAFVRLPASHPYLIKGQEKKA